MKSFRVSVIVLWRADAVSQTATLSLSTKTKARKAARPGSRTRGRDVHKRERAKMLQRLKDKQLPQRARERELRKRPDDGRVRAHERQRALELARARRGRVQDGDVRERQDGEERGERGAERVDPEHHLLARHTVAREDLVLRRVRRAVDREVDEQVGEPDELRVCAAATAGVGLGLAGLLLAEAHEEGDPERDHRDDEVLVPRELAPVEEDVHDHHGHELARLAEHHRGVGDVGERGEAERRGGGDEDRALEVAQEERLVVEAGVGVGWLVCVGVPVRLRGAVCLCSAISMAVRDTVRSRSRLLRVEQAECL